MSTSVQYVNSLVGVKPPIFDWDSTDLPQVFKKFRRYCEILLKTPSYATQEGKELVNYILLWMGPQGVEIFDNWTLSEADKANPIKVWDAF